MIVELLSLVKKLLVQREVPHCHVAAVLLELRSLWMPAEPVPVAKELSEAHLIHADVAEAPQDTTYAVYVDGRGNGMTKAPPVSALKVYHQTTLVAPLFKVSSHVAYCRSAPIVVHDLLLAIVALLVRLIHCPGSALLASASHEQSSFADRTHSWRIFGEQHAVLPEDGAALRTTMFGVRDRRLFGGNSVPFHSALTTCSGLFCVMDHDALPSEKPRRRTCAHAQVARCDAAHWYDTGSAVVPVSSPASLPAFFHEGFRAVPP